MGKNTNRLDHKLKDFLGESKWKETIEQVKKWIDEKKIGEFSLRLGDLRVEYKRDTQDTINTGITAKAEEKAKEWICPRIPEWMTPDMLTGIGVLGYIILAAGFILGFLNRNYLILVVLGFIINWFGDSFDGSIARYRKKTRPNYGYYIDKIVDAVAVIILVLGLGLSGFVKIEIAFLFGLIYLSLMLHADLIVHVQNRFEISFGLFGPTEMRIIGILATVLMYFSGVKYFDIYGHILTQYDFIVFGIAVIMFLVLVVSIIRKGIELNKQDTIDW